MSDQQLYEIADTILKYSKEKTFNIEDYSFDAPQTSHKDLTNNTPYASISNSNNDVNLKTSLTDFRLRRSKELKVKPYYIFTNKILDSLLEKKPRTIDQLLEIEGIGGKKVEEFGKDILSIIKSNLTEDSQVYEPSTKMKSKVQSKNQSIEEIRLALTNFRTRRSKELNVKPYYIFTNNTLESILDKRPASINDLLKIEGIGPKKAEEFGQEILNILNDTSI